MFSIRLFGAPQVSSDQHPVTMTRRKSRALLYYVATHAAPLTRDHLLAFFWPDHERSTGQQNLRATLYGLRKVFGSLLLADDDTLALSPEVWVDTRAFEAQLTAPAGELQALKETLDLYQGDFLSGFTLPDLPEFDDWAMIERERYRRLAVGGLTRLSQLYEARQDYRAGLDTLDQALAFDPLQEDLQRLALRLHYLAGDRAGAVRRYENFRQLLSAEMGVPPMDETRAIYDAIITDTLNPEIWPAPSPLTLGKDKPRHSSTVKSLPFVGREVELQKLSELAAASKLVLIEGEPGIGKSRLMEQFIQAQSKSTLTLIGQARELESALPYHPIIEALRGALLHCDWSAIRPNLKLPQVWQTEAARLLPELAPAGHNPAAVTQATDEIRLWEGVSQFVLALARQLPLVLALDDLHWADSSTLGLLNYLIRKAGQSSASTVFVATSRPTEPRTALTTFLATLTRESRLERLSLNRLSPAEITGLARQLSPAQAGPLADWLAQGSEGNPYILAELDRYARENNLFLPDGTLNLASLPDSPIVPPTVYSLIQARLTRLSEADWQILNAAVAIGREFEFEIVSHAVALSDAAVLDSLDTLQALGLIHAISGSLYRFDHHLTMEVAFQEISEPRHRLFHRRVAEAMETVYSQHRLDTVAGLVAQHYTEGGVPQKAAKYAFRAGQLAAGLAAWSEAIAFFEQALAEAGPQGDPAQRQAVLAALGQACMHAGQINQASAALRAALDLVKAGQTQVNEGVLHLSLASTLLLENRFDEVLALAEEIDACNRPKYAANVAYLRGLALSHSRADLAGAIAYIQEAEALRHQPDKDSDPDEGLVTLNLIEFELGNIFARRGDLPRAIKHYREGLEVTRGLENDQEIMEHILFLNNLAYHLHLLHDPTAVEYAQQGLALAQEKGILTNVPYLWSTLGEIALAQNDLATAEQHFNEGLALAQQFAIPERVAGITANLGLVARQRGEHQQARELLSASLDQAEALNLRHLAVQIRLWLAPLLPPGQAQPHLAAARAVAEQDGYGLLLAEVNRLEAETRAG